TLKMPPPDEHPEVYLEALASAGERLRRRPVLFAASDAAVLFVGEHAEELERLYDFLVPPGTTALDIVDKRRQDQRAAAAGIAIPRTIFPESGDAAVELATDISYPCLLKPLVSHISSRHLKGLKNQVVHDAATLRTEFDRLAAAGAPCLVQEIIPGGD